MFFHQQLPLFLSKPSGRPCGHPCLWWAGLPKWGCLQGLYSGCFWHLLSPYSSPTYTQRSCVGNVSSFKNYSDLHRRNYSLLSLFLKALCEYLYDNTKGKKLETTQYTFTSIYVQRWLLKLLDKYLNLYLFNTLLALFMLHYGLRICYLSTYTDHLSGFLWCEYSINPYQTS